MLSLVNYGASDSEDEITDEEEVSPPKLHLNGSKDKELDDDLVLRTSKIQLPEPSVNKIRIEEEDDEFLHKKETPVTAPPKKEKVRIMIPRLSDFKDEDDDKPKVKIQPVNKKSGLLGILPRPSNSFAPAPKPTSSLRPQAAPVKVPPETSTKSSEVVTKKVGMIPYSLMPHKPKAVDAKKTLKKKVEDSDDDDDEIPSGSFFSFASQEDDLPQVNDDDVRALVDKEAARMEQRKRQHEEAESSEQLEEEYRDLQEQHAQQQFVDEEAMKALLGGNKAKRSRIDNIHIVDLSADQVLPNRDEWLRKTLAGETSYVPTGNISEKVSKALSCVDIVFMNLFRVHRLWQSVSIKSPSSPSARKTTRLNLKRCGRQIVRTSVKQNPNTAFKIC